MMKTCLKFIVFAIMLFSPSYVLSQNPDLSNFFDLENEDTLRLKFGNLACFTGRVQLWLISPNDSSYDVLKVDSIENILSIDKNMFKSEKELDQWMMKNINVLQSEYKTEIYERSQLEKLKSELEDAIVKNKNCERNLSGGSIIELWKNEAEFKVNFDCKIYFSQLIQTSN